MTNKLTTKEVDITPDVSLFKKIGSQPYRIPDATAELVDNEIDAAIPSQKLTVNVTVRMGRSPCIIVQGDGAGMSAETTASALRMAHSTKSSEQIGEFGLGMKAACSNLGKRFELVTCTAEANSGTRVAYDEDAFLIRGSWKIRVEEIEKPFPHGTQITITEPKVNIYAGLKDTMLGKFGSIFKHFIKDGFVEIVVNGEPVVPEEPKLLDEYTKPFAFEVQGHKVRGWYGLMAKSSQVGGYGFELIRNRRAMRRFEKIGFKPHPRLARLTGEIHLEDFPVTNNKMDFVRDTPVWREFEETINKLTSEIRGIAAEKARKKIDQKDLARIDEVRSDVQDAINSAAFQANISRRGLDQLLRQEEADDGEEVLTEAERRSSRNGHPRGSTSGSSNGSGSRTPRLTGEKLQRVKAVLPELEIEHEPMSLGEDAPYKKWDIAALTPAVRLAVATNLDHPMYAEAADDLVLWVKHNMVEAAAEYLCRDFGLEEMLLLKSDLLKHIGRLKLRDITAEPVLD